LAASIHPFGGCPQNHLVLALWAEFAGVAQDFERYWVEPGIGGFKHLRFFRN
jgi:hypothetical protein